MTYKIETKTKSGKVLTHSILDDESRLYTKEEFEEECKYKTELFTFKQAFVELQKFYNWTVSDYLHEHCDFEKYGEINLDAITEALKILEIEQLEELFKTKKTEN